MGRYLRGTLGLGLNGVQGEHLHRSISPTKLSIVFDRRVFRDHQIHAYKEEAGHKWVGAII